MKLLSKDADNRYPSAEALLADLDRFRQGQAIAAASAAPQAPMLGQSGPPTVAMNPGSLSPAAAVGSGQVAVRREIPATYQEPPRRRAGLIMFSVLASGLILAGFLILLQDRLNAPDAEQEIQVAAPQTVTIPAVGGRGASDASSTLAALDLRVDQENTADNDVASGLVIRTEPAAGQVVPIGSTVTIFVSSGANLLSVPSVLTKSENEALQIISRAGFEPSRQAVTSNIAPEGEVVGQDPQPGAISSRPKASS